jgi:hypothetical protein
MDLIMPRSQLSSLVVIALLTAESGVVAQDTRQTQMSSVMQAPLEKSRQAIIECRDKRLKGELSNYAESTRCSNPQIFEAWKAANYPYMDLITKWLNAREVASEKVDQKLITPEAFEREMEGLTARLTAEEKRRRAGLLQSANNTLQLQLPPPSLAAISPASPGNATQPHAAATRSRVSQGNAAVAQGTAWPAAYADAPNPKRTFPLTLPPALDFPADAPKEPTHLVVPSPVAAAEQVRPATVPTPAPQPSVPTMVVVPEAPARSLHEANTSWLLLGTLGGGVVGIAIVWFLVRLQTGRARPTPRRKEEADQSMRHNWASADDNRRDDRAPEYDKRWDDSQEWGETNPPWRDNRASAYDDRWAGSRESEEINAPRRHNRASAYDRRRDDEETNRRWGTPAYDAVRDALGERQEADQPRGRNAASAYDGFFDALTEREEADQPSARNAASADDAVRDAWPGSVTPDAPNSLDQLGTAPPGSAKTRRRNADKMLYDSLEQEITSLLGRPIGKSSQREEADQPSSDNAAFADDAVDDARPRSATRATSNPLDELGTTPPRAAETRRPNAGRILYDSFEQNIASLLGRSTVNSSQSGEADRPSGRNAATVYDAVRDALTEREEADQSSGHNAASDYDAIRDARPRSATPSESNPLDQLGTAPPRVAETRQPNAGKTLYDGFERSMASLLGRSTGNSSQSEEADRPGGRNAATAYEAVRDALGEKQRADQPSGYHAAAAYEAVRDAF